MIKNERQLAEAERKLQSLEAELEKIDDAFAREPYEEMASSIRAEIQTFEAIRSGQANAFFINSLDSLVEVLVKIRLARGWSQRRLAERLGVAEQQVQRDEAGGYETASFYRLADVVEALDYDFHGQVLPKEEVHMFPPLESDTGSRAEHYNLKQVSMPDIPYTLPEMSTERVGHTAFKEYRMAVAEQP